MTDKQPAAYTFGHSSKVLASHTSRTAESDAAFLLPHIKPTDKILDIGCGPGTITAGLAALVPQGSVTAVDLSDSVLDVARSHIATLQSSGALPATTTISFQTGNVLDRLPFADDTFDVIYAGQLFPHLQDPVKAATEIRRVLRPGGVFASRSGAEFTWYPRRLRLDELMTARLVRGMRQEHFNGGDVPAILRQAGFEISGGRAKVAAGTYVFTMPEERQWYAGMLSARLEKGETHRASWVEVGITEEEVEETRTALAEWTAAEDAWCVGLLADVLVWK